VGAGVVVQVGAFCAAMQAGGQPARVCIRIIDG
jgi:hypothetical protein